MKVKTIKRVIASMLLISILAVVSAFLVGAANASNSGTKTSGNSFINWTFYSEGSGSRMSSCRYTRLAPSTGVTVSDRSRIGYDTSEAYGYVNATIYGQTWTSSYLAWHKISNNAITVHKV